MVHSYGYRAGTREKFRKSFRKHGLPAPSRSLVQFKVGDYVDVKADGAVQKGMPHKGYVGRTGKVWLVTPRAVGVVVNKIVRGKVLAKKICVRTAHVGKSKCQADFKDRVKRSANRKKGSAPVKRVPQEPKGGGIVRSNAKKLVTISHVPFELAKETDY